MSRKSPHPKLAIVQDVGSSPASELSDSQFGPLAEALAIADVLNLIAVDQLAPQDNTVAVLTHMQMARLQQVKERVMQLEVAHVR